jgi:site-specific recombinase XerC
VKKDKLARTALKSVQPYDIDSFVARLRGAGLRKKGSLLKVINVLRVGFGAAQRKGLLKTDPFLGFRLPSEKRTVDEWTYLTVAEQRAIVAAAKVHRMSEENRGSTASRSKR